MLLLFQLLIKKSNELLLRETLMMVGNRTVWVEMNDGLPKGAVNLQQRFSAASNGHEGVTGTILLNENGDRSSGIFDYYGVEPINGSYQWYFIGKSE